MGNTSNTTNTALMQKIRTMLSGPNDDFKGCSFFNFWAVEDLLCKQCSTFSVFGLCTSLQDAKHTHTRIDLLM